MHHAWPHANRTCAAADALRSPERLMRLLIREHRQLPHPGGYVNRGALVPGGRAHPDASRLAHRRAHGVPRAPRCVTARRDATWGPAAAAWAIRRRRRRHATLMARVP